MHVEKHGAKLQDFLVRAGEVFDEIVLLYEQLSLMVARGGVLDATHRAPTVGGDVFIRAELVAGEQGPDAEIEKALPGR